MKGEGGTFPGRDNTRRTHRGSCCSCRAAEERQAWNGRKKEVIGSWNADMI